jgi:hypothetical protein
LPPLWKALPWEILPTTTNLPFESNIGVSMFIRILVVDE